MRLVVFNSKTRNVSVIASIAMIWSGTYTFTRNVVTRIGKAHTSIFTLFRKFFSPLAMKVIFVGHAEIIRLGAWTRILMEIVFLVWIFYEKTWNIPKTYLH